VITAGMLAVLIFISMFVDFVHPAVSINMFSSMLLSGFYTFTLINILIYVIRGKKVTKDKIYGGLSVYLLIGFAWAPLYRLVCINNPSSFSGTQSAYAGVYHFDFIYYSFVTICTVGFGDIVPVSGLARSLTLLEAMTGVVYMAVMISRLISLYKTDEEE
jgi:Ion channel